MGSKAHGEPAGESLASPLWQRESFTDEELVEALLAGAMAGPVTSHDRPNVLSKIDRLVGGDPDLLFGMSGVSELSPKEVLSLMAAAAGFNPDPEIVTGPVGIDPWHVLPPLRAAGQRLALAATRGERVLLATGHPVGLGPLYRGVGELLSEHGATLVRSRDGFSWRHTGFWREIRYVGGVAVYCDRSSPLHTHSPRPMEHILSAAIPDLVFADHGFAGAAIEAGIETISIADVNDPAPIVARALGRTQIVIVMDDNVKPEAYWPCFQAIAMAFPG